MTERSKDGKLTLHTAFSRDQQQKVLQHLLEATLCGLFLCNLHARSCNRCTCNIRLWRTGRRWATSFSTRKHGFSLLGVHWGRATEKNFRSGWQVKAIYPKLFPTAVCYPCWHSRFQKDDCLLTISHDNCVPSQTGQTNTKPVATTGQTDLKWIATMQVQFKRKSTIQSPYLLRIVQESSSSVV